MLQITIPAVELWDERKQEFVITKEQTLQLEHSLVSISKWESKWCKPFLSKQEKTLEETLDYIKCMTITQNVDPEVYNYLTNKNIEEINKYIDAPMTATYFSDEKNSKTSREQVTAELIYYWMIAFNIPFECQKWHLNRLLTLIKVCNIKNQPPKKRSKKEIMSRNAALNAARRKRLNTSG
jgi:oligoribonuclease NrnB/cAMP/cGMP phosphodiesterase (DHH superfamily)